MSPQTAPQISKTRPIFLSRKFGWAFTSNAVWVNSKAESMPRRYVAISFCFPATGVHTGCIKSQNRVVRFVKNLRIFVCLNSTYRIHIGCMTFDSVIWGSRQPYKILFVFCKSRAITMTTGSIVFIHVLPQEKYGPSQQPSALRVLWQ